MKILLVEDDPISAALTRGLLTGLGYTEILIIGEGRRAIREADRYRPDLILMDIFLEDDIDGLEAARRICARRKVPIIFLTGHEDIDLVDQVVGTYSFGYLTKPFSRASLHATIKVAAHKHELELKLMESEHKYRELVERAASLILRIDTQGRLTFVNDFAVSFFGHSEADLIGRPMIGTIVPPIDTQGRDTKAALERTFSRPEARRSTEGEVLRRGGARAWVAWTNRPEYDGAGRLVGLLLVGNDITTLNHLLQEQRLDIDLADKIVGLINPTPTRNTPLPNDLNLFADVFYAPCHQAGGDHYFIRRLPNPDGGSGGRTVVSLKDQSGHKVGCILRSIGTDLIHNSLLQGETDHDLGRTIGLVNTGLCRSSLFAEDDFVTSISAVIDHRSLEMEYLSTGHPPFILIRDGRVEMIGGLNRPGTNLPLGMIDQAEFKSAKIRLKSGDRLIFYTDGLTDLPRRNHQWTIARQELTGMIEAILAQEPELPVSLLIRRLIRIAAEMSGEVVRPFSRNTSVDDLTVIGLQVEDAGIFEEEIWQPPDVPRMAELIKDLAQRLTAREDWTGWGISPGRLRLVLEEATLNAWRHGNRLDPEKKIRIRYRFGNDFHLEVIDQGEGFDYHHLPDPLALENLDRSSGRGLFIMKKFASEVAFREGGRQVIMTFSGRTGDEAPEKIHSVGNMIRIWD